MQLYFMDMTQNKTK